MENHGLTVEEFQDIICEVCLNNPIAYYCPACDRKLCFDCLPKGVKKLRNGAFRCRRCGNVDKALATYVGFGKA